MASFKTRITKHFLRERIESPSKFDPRSFRIKRVSPTTEIIVGCPKGRFKSGRCLVGTKAQAILKRR
jgi:hypothetical protein